METPSLVLMIQTHRRYVTSHTQIRRAQLPRWWDQGRIDKAVNQNKQIFLFSWQPILLLLCFDLAAGKALYELINKAMKKQDQWF